MAKDAHDREDLLRDATGYVHRMEFRIRGCTPTLFSGFRLDGAWSLYWGQDQVVQFNLEQELRRAYWDGRLLASYRRRLHWLDRRPTAAAKYTREPLSASNQASFLSLWEQRLSALRSALDSDDYQRIGQVPPTEDVATETRQWLAARKGPLRLAMHPGISASRGR